MLDLRKLVWVLALAMPALAADVAVLRNGFSIPHARREEIGSVTRLYVVPPGTGYVDVPTSQIDHFDHDFSVPAPTSAPAPSSVAAPTGAPASSPALGDVVASASERHRIDPDLVQSVIRAESGFNVRAVSPKGAQGLMQLMPQTASVLGVNNAFDPVANVDGGTRYLRMLLEHYNFDLVKALAAYNAGPQRVEQYGGVPPYYETRAYVARIIRDFNQKKLAEQKTAVAAKARPAKTTTASKSALPSNSGPSTSR